MSPRFRSVGAVLACGGGGIAIEAGKADPSAAVPAISVFTIVHALERSFDTGERVHLNMAGMGTQADRLVAASILKLAYVRARRLAQGFDVLPKRADLFPEQLNSDPHGENAERERRGWQGGARGDFFA